jgi:hypothetical protein
MSADRLLSLSQAARMAGVTRKILQQHISCGDLSTFEGYVRMSDLRTVYPEVIGDRSGMIEKVRRIQDAAALKKCVDKIKDDPQRLAYELHKVGLEIARLQKEVESYKQLAAVTEERLVEMQEQCQSKEATMLSTLIGWHMNQLKIRQPH